MICKKKLRQEVEHFIIENCPLLIARHENRKKYLAFQKSNNKWELLHISSEHLLNWFLEIEDYFNKEVVFIYNH